MRKRQDKDSKMHRYKQGSRKLLKSKSFWYAKKERWKYSIQKHQRKKKKNRTFVYTSSCRVEKYGRAPGVNATRQNQCRTTRVSFQPDSINNDACWSSTPQKRQLFSYTGQTGRNVWFLRCPWKRNRLEDHLEVFHDSK